MTSSVPLDSFFKMTGATEANYSRLSQVPFPEVESAVQNATHIRVLGLNCLTGHYLELWGDAWDDSYRSQEWTKLDPRLPSGYYAA